MQVYKKARTLGFGDNDFSAVYKAIADSSWAMFFEEEKGDAYRFEA